MLLQHCSRRRVKQGTWLSAQDCMTRTYGGPCFRHSDPPGPSSMYT